jgi:rare lipoprotein A
MAHPAQAWIRNNALAVIFAGAVSGCAVEPLPPQDRQVSSAELMPAVPAVSPEHHDEQPTFTQIGVASWYRETGRFKRTADGEKPSPAQLTAAHRSLPFGTIVRVTSIRTGRSVVVRINDRGPYKRGRIIDLSFAAAKDLGILQGGISKVRLAVYSFDQARHESERTALDLAQ